MAPDSKMDTGAPRRRDLGQRLPECDYWRNRQKFRLELAPSAEVDRMDRVGNSRLFEEQSDLVPVRGGPIIQVDHREGLAARRPALHECR